MKHCHRSSWPALGAARLRRQRPRRATRSVSSDRAPSSRSPPPSPSSSARPSSFKTPVVESTGTGGGFKLFCAGVGDDSPDISNASRAIKESEIETCAKNGVTEITEIKIGYDGIVLANSKADAQFNLTREQIWLALAKEVPVDGKLVAEPVQDLGRHRSVAAGRARSRCSARRRPPARATPSSSW